MPRKQIGPRIQGDKKVGYGGIRTDGESHELYDANGKFIGGRLDEVVLAADKAKMGVMVILQPYAAANFMKPKEKKDDYNYIMTPAQYRQFALDFVTYYQKAKNVRFIQYMNEPDGQNHPLSPGEIIHFFPRPDVIKGANPDIKTIGPALIRDTGLNYSERMKGEAQKNGLNPFPFDYAALNLYFGNHPATFAEVQAMHDLTGLPVMATEIGWSTAETTPEDQALFTKQYLQWLLQHRDIMPLACIYKDYDSPGADPADFEQNTGVLYDFGEGGQEKPVAEVIRKITAPWHPSH